MVYIHVKRVGNKKYYTLRLSVRQKDRVITKDLENLGSDITKIKIEDLEKKYKKEIRRSYKTIKKFLEQNYFLDKVGKKKLKKVDFLSADQLQEVEAAKLHYSMVFNKLDKLTQRDCFEMFLINFAVSSSAIEGNTISLKEARRLLMEQIVPKNKTLREVYDLQNTKEVFSNLLEQQTPIGLKMIEEVHDKLLEKIDNRLGYRTKDIRIFGQPFKPSPGRYVKEDMQMLLKWYNKQKRVLHPFILAVLFHHKFENIHPFADGNGRTGRILMNHILMLRGYPPLVVPNRFRTEYLDVLSEADKGIEKDLLNQTSKHYGELVNFLADQYKISYWDNFLV